PSARALRVPPVEISSVPKASRPRAKSRRLDLSLTLSKARRMGRKFITGPFPRSRQAGGSPCCHPRGRRRRGQPISKPSSAGLGAPGRYPLPPTSGLLAHEVDDFLRLAAQELELQPHLPRGHGALVGWARPVRGGPLDPLDAPVQPGLRLVALAEAGVGH